jgi:hypothetical protein
VSADFAAGKSITWQFTSNEKRLSVTLPKEFGGRTYKLPLVGGYTLAPLRVHSGVPA